MSCHCLNRKIKCLAKANRIQDKQIKQLIADVDHSSKVNIGQSVALGALASDKKHLTLTVTFQNDQNTINIISKTPEINATLSTDTSSIIVTSDNMTSYGSNTNGTVDLSVIETGQVIGNIDINISEFNTITLAIDYPDRPDDGSSFTLYFVERV